MIVKNKKFRVNIESFILNPLDKDVYDISIPSQTVEFEEEYSYQTILKIKKPTYREIKEVLLRIADQNYAALGDNIKFAALISIWVESDDVSVLDYGNEEVFEFVCKYIIQFEPKIRYNNNAIDVANSSLCIR